MKSGQMNAVQRIKQLVEEYLGIAVFRDTLPHGTLIARDFKEMGIVPQVIFDVGANIGQSAFEYAIAWPDAEVHSFEPIQSSFQKLRENTDRFQNVSCNRIALGDKDGEARVTLRKQSQLNSLVVNAPNENIGRERVTVRTLTGFCSAHGIDQIDFLKIDTEGYDLKVLQGAEEMLSHGRIMSILTEVGFVGGGTRFVRYGAMNEYLTSHGFSIAGFYDQTIGYKSVSLRRANALFTKA